MLPALILAAGASSRMGRTKALLPLAGGDTFLGRLEKTLRAAGLDDVVAVIGYDAEAILAHAARVESRIRFARNPNPSRGQLSSLVAGFDALSRGPVLVTPVDLPLVTTATVRLVVEAWRATGAPIVRPECDGRHGHPVIFSSAIVEELRMADLDAGARPVIHAHRDEIVDVPVQDDGAFEDIDTPEDYARLIERGREDRIDPSGSKNT